MTENTTTLQDVITEIDCDECEGTGNDDHGDTCNWCRGVGTVERTVRGVVGPDGRVADEK